MPRMTSGLCCLIAASLLAVASASAAPVIIPAPPQLAASAYMLLDARSGKVIVERNADLRLPPASLTKIMTSYIAATEIERGDLSLDEMVDVSVAAWKMGGSRMYIREGTQVSVEDLLRGIVIQSGNDASVAIAEHIAGSEDAFVDVMNQLADHLGMHDTHYVNATGWPDEGHYTTARDLATLTRALIRDHPDHYALYAEKEFEYNDIRQRNRNLLLWRDRSIDGVKTGHTDAAGYCLVASGEREGMRLISVLLGAESEEARAQESQKLLTYGFRYYETHPLYRAATSLSRNRVWGGARNELDLGLTHDVVVTIPRGRRGDLSAAMDIASVIEAPFEKGAEFGTLTVTLGDEQLAEAPLVALAAVEEAGFFGSTGDSILLFFAQLFGMDTMH